MNYLTKEQILSVYLPKWPGCDVTGNPVTKEQAAEILVRTTPYFISNDREFEKKAEDIFYSVIPMGDWGEGWWRDEADLSSIRDRLQQYAEKMGLLNLEYLVNQRVCSSYIGGPNGWCNWDGSIYQRNKNIGKWPESLSVFNEWGEIAKEFPYLNLVCKLFTHEAGFYNENPEIALVFEVCDGEVKARLPVESDYEDVSVKQTDEEFNMFTFPVSVRERGVSLEYWKECCEMVSSKMLAKYS